MRQILVLFFVVFLGGSAFAKTEVAVKDTAFKVMIMEDVLFAGITGSTQLEVIDKKIQAVDQSIADPLQKYADADMEVARIKALQQLKARLEKQKSELPTNTSVE